MNLDYSKLSDEELEAIANNDYSKLSDATLQAIAQQPDTSAQKPPGSSETSLGGVSTQLAAPAVTGAAYAAPTGLARIGSDVADVARAGMKAVAARPVVQTLADVVGVASHGLPYGSLIRKGGEIFTGVTNPTTVGQSISALGSAVKAAPGYIAGMAGPALRGAARVAGPAGMAYNMYEAYPHLQQANIGPRMQSGEVAQMSRGARQAQMSMPTPAPLSPQEAANLLMSGDQRTIDIYGGAQRLSQQAAGAPKMRQPAPQPTTADLDARIRAAAAKRALMMGQQGQ